MVLNPITFTEKVVGDFLRYQATAYRFADPRLHEQMRHLLSLDETRGTPLLQGPYVSLSRAFRMGESVMRLVEERVLHPFMRNLIPYEALWGHQVRAIRAIANGQSTLISTGTGSGKTECFLYPVIGRCLELRDGDAPAGIVAIFVYPMNALAEDQLGRMRELLAGTGISFGLYVGKTPERTAGVAGERLRPSASREDYRRAFERASEEGRGTAVHPPEERASREEMRAPGKQPRILLTNVKQLELLLTRQMDLRLFDGARLEYLVFDEAHTYGGAAGGETACLIRRLRAFCEPDDRETVCVGTSATLVDPGGDEEPTRAFGARFFGVPGHELVLVEEVYEEEEWEENPTLPAALVIPSPDILGRILEALGNEDGAHIAAAFRDLTSAEIRETGWREELYAALVGNELCFRISQALQLPMDLETLSTKLSEDVNRPTSEEEILAYLALGAAARRNDRPLLRPVVHGFVRGVGSAVVTFPGEDGPRLWLSGEGAHEGDGEPLYAIPILACNTCGQHYFEHHVNDLTFDSSGLSGGEAVGDRRVWRPLDISQGGIRVVLLDGLVSAEEEDDDPGSTRPVFFCRYCGALHPSERTRCDACGREGALVRLLAVEPKPERPGYLTSCLSCKSVGLQPGGGRWREPARPVRAVAVSDVHVLAQNMLHNAERPRLLVFADNRQDAAFQAGWMRDHARRFRLRSLMTEWIEEGSVSIGDLVAFLEQKLEADEELSRALVPEVWNVHRKEAAGTQHAADRAMFLRILVLREVATGVKQRIGLEPWGRIRVEYHGLSNDLPFIREWAERLSLDPERLVEGIEAILDVQRRGMYLLDREGRIFSKFWGEGDYEIQRGYLPRLKGVPKGLKLRRTPGDDPDRVAQWLSERGDTMVRQAAKSFGVESEHVEEFVAGLWQLLTHDLRVLAPVTLTGSRGHALPNCAGVYQIDADFLRITPHRGRWRCGTCRRVQVRRTPNDRCLRWHCIGTLKFEEDDPDDYDLLALEEGFAMLRPFEHSAQVPAEERERIERLFKGDGEQVNTLVATPTLELGVDIGTLDTVLLRNVPPLPSNYWQRVGRAGRRHRLAVALTYARPTTHDRAYFVDPLKLLEGRVVPPRFNLKNELMVRKHVHASVLTRLNEMASDNDGLGDFDREEIRLALVEVFPTTVTRYLFEDNGRVRGGPFDVSPLNTVVTKHEADLIQTVQETFRARWPDEDREVVSDECLQGMMLGMPDGLAEVIGRLRKRLNWCLRQMRRLDEERSERGTLDPDEDALYRRCDLLVKRLKGMGSRARREAEGYDDTHTYGVLAAEGFLPGYGLEVGSIIATAIMPRHVGSDFYLPRPPAVALREFVPGNLIYANGHRFVARYFHFDPASEEERPVEFRVDLARAAVAEIGTTAPGTELASLGAAHLKAVPVCDVDLAHFSHITDDEDFRFQMPVALAGYEQGRHGPGQAYRWAEKDLLFRRGVHLRLVNYGAAWKVEERLGYPVSLMSGQSRSPFSSRRELEEFSKGQEERYGRPVEWIGFYADVVADSLTLAGCKDRVEAHSLLEALRVGMNHLLEMEREDLDILAIGHVGRDEVDAVLFDPMPGGSGLIEQALERWPEVIAAAREAVLSCESDCERSCIDCLQTFRNAYFHRYLDRHRVAERLAVWGDALEPANPIPERMPAAKSKQEEMPVNEAESLLQDLLRRASLPAGIWHHEISLGRPLGNTRPDVFYAGEDDFEPGFCVYLDGLSEHIHGNDETAARDRRIREELRARRYLVIEIPATELHDRDAMTGHFSMIARWLIGPEKARELRGNAAWFDRDAGVRDEDQVYEEHAPLRREVAEEEPDFRSGSEAG